MTHPKESVFIIDTLFDEAVAGAEAKFGLQINQEAARYLVFKLFEGRRNGDQRKPHLIVSDILNSMDGYREEGCRRSSMHSLVTRYLRALTNKNVRTGSALKPGAKGSCPRNVVADRVAPTVNHCQVPPRYDPVADARRLAEERNEHIVNSDDEDMEYVHEGSGSPFGWR